MSYVCKEQISAAMAVLWKGKKMENKTVKASIGLMPGDTWKEITHRVTAKAVLNLGRVLVYLFDGEEEICLWDLNGWHPMTGLKGEKYMLVPDNLSVVQGIRWFKVYQKKEEKE